MDSVFKHSTQALRFDGFDGEWETQPLTKLGSSYGGLTGKTKDDFGHGAAHYITYLDVFEHAIIKDASQLGTTEVDNRQNTVKTGDALFTVSSEVPEEVGMSAVWLGQGQNIYLNSFCFGFRPTAELDSKFLAYVLRAPDFREKMSLLAQGISRFNISKLKAMQVAIGYPVLEEQRAIGELFADLDALIEQHRAKHAILQQTKTALMQRMFPQDGADEPELRLGGVSGAWEPRIMRDCAEYSKGSGYSKKDIADEGIPVIHYGRLYTKYETAITNVDTFASPQPGALISRGDEVLVPASGETAEDIAIASALLQTGVLIGGDLNVIRPRQNFDPVFLALSLSNGAAKETLVKRAQGKSVVHLRNSDIQDVEIFFPTFEEQRAIGEVFSNLDALIAAEQRYITQLTQAKTALLQRMFV